jgi:hypothetical protein
MVSLRPTIAQAIGRGGYLGVLVGLAVSAVVVLASWMTGGWSGDAGWPAVLAPLILGGVTGAVLGLAFGRSGGADVDDVGVRPVPDLPIGRVPWRGVEDLRTERRGGRIRVAVYLTGGRAVRLSAPYNGRLLGADPHFERKLFMLRHLWETHRHSRYLDPDM